MKLRDIIFGRHDEPSDPPSVIACRTSPALEEAMRRNQIMENRIRDLQAEFDLDQWIYSEENPNAGNGN